MELNGKGLRAIRGIRGIVYGVIAIIIGLAAIGFGIYLFFKPIPSENGDNSPVFNFVAIGLGAAFVIVGVIMIIRARQSMKLSKPLSEEEVKANEERLRAGAPEIANLTDVKLFFHFGGKMNQSFFVEDKEGKTVYECRLKRFNPFGANLFEFVDVEHDYSKQVKVGKTVTSSVDGGFPIVGETLTSRFKIDGVPCWDYLHRLGYEIKHRVFERSITNYALFKLGKQVADIVACNIKDPWNEGSKNILMMGRGAYRIEIIDCRLEDAVMAAFIATQTDMIE